MGMRRRVRSRDLAILASACPIFRGARKTMPRKISPATRNPPRTLGARIIQLPKLPPKVTWLNMPSLRLKKESNPHTAKAKLMPPKHQFQCLKTDLKRPRQTTQIMAPRAIPHMTNPAPNQVSMLSQAKAPQRDTAQYSNAITTISSMSLRIGGETTKPKRPFHLGWVFLALCLVLALRLLDICTFIVPKTQSLPFGQNWLNSSNSPLCTKGTNYTSTTAGRIIGRRWVCV